MAKVLTVKNPWAWLIAQGIKDIENRTWRTNFRGRVLIHASAYQNIHVWDELPYDYREELRKFNHKQQEMNLQSFLTRSKILCSVEIVDCVINHPSIWAEKGTTEDGKQIYNWVIANPQPEPQFEGLKIKGALSLWDFSEDRIIRKGVPNV